MPRELTRGLLIAIEGIDGAGKTTQVAALTRRLLEMGFAVVASKEPTSGPWGQQLRRSAIEGRLGPRAELDLFIKDRREHVENLIRPALERRAIVILDRYYFSTVAYQGVRGLDPAAILAENEAFAPVPDILVVIRLDPEEAILRIDGRDEDGANHFEREDLLRQSAAIFEDCVKACPRKAPDGRTVRAISLDGSQSRENLAESILSMVIITGAEQIADQNLPPEQALDATMRLLGSQL